jgi:hypothetical protein
MTNLTTILNEYGILGVKAIQTVLRPESATGDTVRSIRFEVKVKDTITSLIIFGRKFLGAMETGRGPRTSSEYQEYDKSLLKWMGARGIGADLPQKKKEQLARFLAYKINKEGDDLHKSGGRVLYTPVIEKLEKEITDRITQDFIQSTITRIKDGFNDNNQADRA